MEREELYEGITQRHLGLSLKTFLLIVAVIIFVVGYINIIFQGTNSIKVWNELEIYKESLETEIVKLKDTNADLQYQYFELKEATAQ